ncbi:hypothetical protein [Thalassolituus sp.]|jgi:hypothetical protein|uniref:hypothetical protein n=1 Tax=Thalassolituus sp. TaxID=2030822 RepID=UPI0032D99076
MVKQLQGPNFEQAPITSFNIDGTHLYIPIPQECNDNTKCAESHIEALDRDEIYNVIDPEFMFRKYLLKTNFGYSELNDKLRVGSIYIDLDLLRVDGHRPDSCKTILNDDGLRDLYFDMLKYEEGKIRAQQSAEKSDKYLVFPKSLEEIETLKFDGSSWLFAICGYAEVTKPYRRFMTSITNNHVLTAMITVGGFDFGSVELEQQLVAEADQYILDFIKSIRIDYSPETLAEIQRVCGDVTA